MGLLQLVFPVSSYCGGFYCKESVFVHISDKGFVHFSKYFFDKAVEKMQWPEIEHKVNFVGEVYGL